jgi:hypothetical protein
MHSKNKKPMNAAERAHVARVKELPCSVCNAPGPSEAHEPVQGLWFVSIALCADCHRGTKNGIHGEKVMWRIHKIDEWGALDITHRRLVA